MPSLIVLINSVGAARGETNFLMKIRFLYQVKCKRLNYHLEKDNLNNMM